jgi:MraZ protein
LDFIGSHEHSVDTKGRCFVPRDFMEQLKDREPRHLFVTRGVRCLELFPESAWLKYKAEIEAKPEGDPDKTLILQVRIGQAKKQAIDSTGRILIPEELRQMASISDRVFFVGLSSFMQLWSYERWMPKRNLPDEELEAAMARLANKR